MASASAGVSVVRAPCPGRAPPTFADPGMTMMRFVPAVRIRDSMDGARAVAERHHHDHRGDADDDSQRRQRRPHHVRRSASTAVSSVSQSRHGSVVLSIHSGRRVAASTGISGDAGPATALASEPTGRRCIARTGGDDRARRGASRCRSRPSVPSEMPTVTRTGFSLPSTTCHNHRVRSRCAHGRSLRCPGATAGRRTIRSRRLRGFAVDPSFRGWVTCRSGISCPMPGKILSGLNRSAAAGTRNVSSSRAVSMCTVAVIPGLSFAPGSAR